MEDFRYGGPQMITIDNEKSEHIGLLRLTAVRYVLL